MGDVYVVELQHLLNRSYEIFHPHTNFKSKQKTTTNAVILSSGKPEWASVHFSCSQVSVSANVTENQPQFSLLRISHESI